MQKDVKIQLTRYDVSKKDLPDSLGSYPLVVRAQGHNIDSEIFVYHAINSEVPYSGDVFEVVATPNHLEEIPKNKPYISQTDDEAVPFYRRSQLEILCRSPEELDKIWETLKVEVKSLVANYKALEKLNQTEILEINEKGITIKEEALKSNIESLYAEPATSVDLSETGEIVIPDPTMPGWLPVTQEGVTFGNLPNFDNLPSNTKFYYNLATHAVVKKIFDSGIKTPTNIHRILFNGYDYGMPMYKVTEEGIFWRSYDPEDFSDDLVRLPSPTKNPWPDDYFLGYGSSNPNIISFINYFS